MTCYLGHGKDGFIILLSLDQDNDNIIGDERKGQNDVYEVAIVGSGFAGLSAALLLGRYLLPTVIFDGAKLEITNPKTFMAIWVLKTRRRNNL